jgi:integrase/recombinase XerD
MHQRKSIKRQAKKAELVAAAAVTPAALLGNRAESLAAWFTLYVELEAGANSENTQKAKRADLQAFLTYFSRVAGTDHPDQWTRSITGGFLRHLEKKEKRRPTTINRMLATLRHAARWIHGKRPFLAGDPTERIADIAEDEPEWKGLSDLEVTRLKAASEQLVKLKTRKNQQPFKGYAVLLVLLGTGLRVSELVACDFGQYQGKHLRDVKRKGRKVTRSVFLPKDAREALDRYLAEERGKEAGPLFTTRNGNRLRREDVQDILNAIAAQANASLAEGEKIRLTPHVLRHTMLRRVAEEHGIQYAMELSGHTSSRYIWRYVKPPRDKLEEAVEGLF